MTASYRFDHRCPHCGGKIEAQTQFSSWIRKQKLHSIDDERFNLTSGEFSCHNLDYVWHHFRRDNWLITIEEKRRLAKVAFTQKDTHGIVAQLLNIASGSIVRNERGDRIAVEYRGHYVVRFQGDGPETSDYVMIADRRFDGTEAIERALRDLLATGRQPEPVLGDRGDR